jgi:single-stranded-DNA-specific exonuclease
MVDKQWILREVDLQQRAALVQALSISSITATILVARGITTLHQAQRWLSPQGAVPYDPYLIPDMETAVERLHQAVTGGERICFYGDYDVDGIAATSLYLTYFRSLGAQVSAYIPDRLNEGYGVNEAALRWLQQEGVTLVVTSDCGTTAHREVEAARRSGLDVIITDHHQPDAGLPPALAILNPHRADSRYPFTGLCSGGLAYKVVRAYDTRYGGAGIDPESLLDLAALATIADVVPLQDENRLLVREGLSLLGRGTREAGGRNHGRLHGGGRGLPAGAAHQCGRAAGPCPGRRPIADDHVRGGGQGRRRGARTPEPGPTEHRTGHHR